MSDDADEFWSWLHSPLWNLKHSLTARPEMTWIERREQFLAELGQPDSQGHPYVRMLIMRLDEMSDEDRDSVLSADEIDRRAYEIIQQAGTFTDIAGGYDAAAWNGYLIAGVTQWDGSAESWDSFKEWFIYYAVEVGLSEPAHDFVRYVDDMSLDDRIATFVHMASVSDQHEVIPPSRDAVVAEIAKEVPGFERLSEQEMAEIISEVMRESGR